MQVPLNRLRWELFGLILATSIPQSTVLAGVTNRWLVEMPVHFQWQYGVVGVLAVVALTWVTRKGPRRTWLDRGMIALGLFTTLHAWAEVLAVTPSQWSLRPTPAAASDGGTLFRVLCANLYSANTNHQDLIDQVNRERPDVVVLTEVTSRWASALSAIEADYRWHDHRADDLGNFGIGTWSRHPIAKAEYVSFDAGMPQMRLTIDVGGTPGQPSVPIELWAVHPLPPVSNHNLAERNRVFEGLSTAAAGSTLPTILAGDFNASRHAPAFVRLCRTGQLRDAGAPSPLGRTWPAGAANFIFGVQIDHVLVSPHWRVAGFRIGPDIGSDHYPIIADLMLSVPRSPSP